MTLTSPRNRDASEIDNRAHWFLTELGRFPTRNELRRIRQYRRAVRKQGGTP
ncbi:hypothetical protein GCM10022234_00770 [Aeromicrobium panaciterrae]